MGDEKPPPIYIPGRPEQVGSYGAVALLAAAAFVFILITLVTLGALHG